MVETTEDGFVKFQASGRDYIVDLASIYSIENVPHNEGERRLALCGLDNTEYVIYVKTEESENLMRTWRKALRGEL